MNSPGVIPGSRESLESQGFEGFLRVGELHADGCRAVPNERGVYVMVRESTETPRFMARSAAPDWRGMNPSLLVVELEDRWVSDTPLLFIAAAPGPGVRNLLRQRVKRYLRFGCGAVVGHWTGRFVWQLTDHRSLRVAWRVTAGEDPAAMAGAMCADFENHHGRPPFANETGSPGDE